MFELIRDIVCRGEGIRPDLLTIKSRVAGLVFARQVIAALCYEYGMDEYNIAPLLMQDRTTILYSVKTAVPNYELYNKSIAAKIEQYRQRIKERLALSSDIDIMLTIKAENDELKASVIKLQEQIERLERVVFAKNPIGDVFQHFSGYREHQK